jgi:predicted ABC-type ATPase
MPKPKLLIVAGPNGSGKTTVTRSILSHEWMSGCEYINPDDVARDMFGDWNSPEATLKAAQYCTSRREECLAAGQSFIFETVFSAPDKIVFIEEARRRGYFVRLFFIATDNPRINAERIALRVMRSSGHEVPVQKIISRYGKSIVNCAIAAPLVDRLYVYDNSIDDAFPHLLFRAGDGCLAKQYAPVNAWAEEIFSAVAGVP